MKEEKLIITYINGDKDEFTEKQLCLDQWTIKGHACQIIEKWKIGGVYQIDNYNAIDLNKVISVRVI